MTQAERVKLINWQGDTGLTIGQHRGMAVVTQGLQMSWSQPSGRVNTNTWGHMCGLGVNLMVVIETSLVSWSVDTGVWQWSKDEISWLGIKWETSEEAHCWNFLKGNRESDTMMIISHKRLWRFPGMGVPKPISSLLLFSQIFTTVKTHVNYKISYSYLTGVDTAELRRHLTIMNVI